MKAVLLLFNISLFFTTFGQKKEQLIIHFEYNKSELLLSAKSQLDSLMETDTATIQSISLYGHCDSVGNNLYNDKLSNDRVNAVKNYLAEKGLTPDLITTEKGFGKRRPLNDNSSEEARYLNRRVEINITRKSGPDKSQAKKTTEQSTLDEKIRDVNTKNGSNIILRKMNFYGGRHVLLPESLPALQELVQALRDNPSLEIEIQGHICCTPGAEDGVDMDLRTDNLSVNRAKAIYEYLIKQGIDAGRLSYKGLAHSMPLVYPEDTEEKKTLNRRVEIKILHK